MRHFPAILGVLWASAVFCAPAQPEIPKDPTRVPMSDDSPFPDPDPNPPPKKFVFLSDLTKGSMTGKIPPVYDAIIRAIDRFRVPQAFDVIIVGPAGPQSFGKDAIQLAVTQTNRDAADFIVLAKVPEKPVEPIAAIRLALKREAQLLCILTDHEWADRDGVVRAILEHKNRPKFVEVIYVVNPGGAAPSDAMRDAMNKIARIGDGTPRIVKSDEIGEIARSGTPRPASQPTTRPNP